MQRGKWTSRIPFKGCLFDSGLIAAELLLCDLHVQTKIKLLVCILHLLMKVCIYLQVKI